MCNLYNVSTNQEAIRALTRTFRDMIGNLPPSLDVYPDYPAPVVRIGEDGKRELANLRWGMPSPPQYAGPPITNIRNTASSYWRRWLGPQNRCLGQALNFALAFPQVSKRSDDRRSTAHQHKTALLQENQPGNETLYRADLSQTSASVVMETGRLE